MSLSLCTLHVKARHAVAFFWNTEAIVTAVKLFPAECFACSSIGSFFISSSRSSGCVSVCISRGLRNECWSEYINEVRIDVSTSFYSDTVDQWSLGRSNSVLWFLCLIIGIVTLAQR